ncbi:hypothetical protein LSH36_649g00021 [Paralvinella palmiformis]|uniref:Uncharacterized protein n=1 Tax=Paralvinella palmiformis TaxID=53620 RepID=A0AAD9MVQ3_9ANNE|nr:hypothetical protein LSH36_649g00021 [Paralvinella palmiformis]
MADSENINGDEAGDDNHVDSSLKSPSNGKSGQSMSPFDSTQHLIIWRDKKKGTHVFRVQAARFDDLYGDGMYLGQVKEWRNVCVLAFSLPGCQSDVYAIGV